jgi:hypothetical protein
VRWTLLLFAATLPLEAARVPVLSWSLSWAKLAGLPFLLCYLWDRRAPAGRLRVPRAGTPVLWFGGYVGAYALTRLAAPHDPLEPWLARLLLLLQLGGFLWVVSDLLGCARLARHVLLAYALGSAAWALGILANVPALAVARVESRTTSLGYDPNTLGVFLALGVVILIGLWLEAPSRRTLVNAVLLGAAAPLAAVVAQSGSRTAVAALILGLATYAVPARGPRAGRRALWTLAGVGLLLLLLVGTSTARGHWLSTWRGLLARSRIAAEAVGMVRERPLAGWQSGYPDELGRRQGRATRVEHNLVLHLLVETGVVGAAPFLAGLALCARGAWRRRTGRLGRLPLAALVTVLVANMALPLMVTKPFWLVLALGAAPDDARA